MSVKSEFKLSNQNILSLLSLGFGSALAYLLNYRLLKDNQLLKKKLELEQNQTDDSQEVVSPPKRSPTKRTTIQRNLISKLRKQILEKARENQLIEELISIESQLSEIVPVSNLIIDRELQEFEGFVTPLLTKQDGSATPEQLFMYTNAFILWKAAFGPMSFISNTQKWLRAGPRKINYFNPQGVQALIVTCGGLCPGLNVVIRELVMCLSYNYGAQNIYGAKYGYKGIYSLPLVKLTADQVKDIHTTGGTFLGTSRGGFDLEKIIESLIKNGINQVYLIGGDGTLRGANQLFQEIQQRKLDIAVCGVPKTIDNDIPIIDESFGFNSGVEESVKVINAVYSEAISHENGVGLVQLMGRNAGFIAMDASLAARIVNICLIPEFEFQLYGKNGLLEHVIERLKSKNHCIICVAEGAADGLQDYQVENIGVDASGNVKISDIGEILRQEIPSYGQKQGMDITLKYIDPTYIIRAIPANAYDIQLCSQLAQNAIHGLMAGYTGFCIAHVNMKTCFIPFTEMCCGQYPTQVTYSNRDWQRLLASTGQPSFIDANKLQDNLTN